MRAPEFWRAGAHAGLPTAVLPTILTPLSWAWSIGGALRRATTPPRSAPVPVICVGNLVAGGAGKTPVALALGRRIRAGGRAVHFVARGYGGRLRGPIQVDPARHGVGEVGDEPLLLARVAPTWVARARAAGAAAAARAGAAVVVLDDGHQYPGLAKDLSVVVIDGDYRLGNGRVIPAGPLREPAAQGLARADAVILVEGARPAGRDDPFGAPDRPVLRARLFPEPAAAELAGRRVVGFAGIGRPDKFFHTLTEIGCEVVAPYPFPDHHVYSADQIMQLVEAAAARDALPVTTEKDHVRLPPESRPMVEPVAVRLEFADPDRLDDLLARVVVVAQPGD